MFKHTVRSIFRALLGRRLPITEGRLKVSGIKRPVEIRRDSHGIPYIRAHSDSDAWYGVGFCQGQDRTFQLELLLRITRGRLSELMGEDTLPIDRLSRRIGFFHAAKEQLQIMDASDRQLIEAFARGVTDGAQVGVHHKAHAFTLLRSSPTPFTAADVLGILKLLSFLLPSNWDAELARLQILKMDGPEAVKALEPDYPEWLPSTIPADTVSARTLERLAEDLAFFTRTAGRKGGSNNWGLAPSHTAHGNAILASDPHLEPSLPPHWYLSHVRTDEWMATGASLAGTPGFPVGFNEYLAWGITAGLTDNTDLFIEKIGPDGTSVLDGDQFVDCDVRREWIEVRRGDPVEEEVLITPRGPIIGPALAGKSGAISLKAVWLEPSPFEGFLRVQHAQTTEAFQQAFEQWPFLPLNVIFADTDSIGWQLVGEAPRRRTGWGTIPLPGWDPTTGWEDQHVAFQEMPHLIDPARGFLATANNRPKPDDEGPFLGTDWVDGFRAARILELLGSRTDWTVDDMLEMQTDVQSLPWRKLKKIILSIPVPSENVQHGLDILSGWDGNITSESAPAAVFEHLVAEMSRRVVFAQAPAGGEWALGKGLHPLVPHSIFALRRVGHLIRLLREQPEDWFDRSWPEELADALDTVIRRLRQQHGDDERAWAWGDLRTLTLEHPLGRQKPLHLIYNRGPFPWGGDSNTIAQASVSPTDPTENPLFVPSLRMVVETGNWENNRFSLPGGQSGNPLSPHYDDLLTFWREGEGVRIAWAPETVRRSTQAALQLTPL